MEDLLDHKVITRILHILQDAPHMELTPMTFMQACYRPWGITYDVFLVNVKALCEAGIIDTRKMGERIAVYRLPNIAFPSEKQEATG